VDKFPHHGNEAEYEIANIADIYRAPPQILFKTIKNDKEKEKRGLKTLYLVSNDEEDLLRNTIPGALIKILREKGPLSQEEIVWHLQEKYKRMRNLQGQLYKSSLDKAVKGALTGGNEIFEEIGHKRRERKRKSEGE